MPVLPCSRCQGKRKAIPEYLKLAMPSWARAQGWDKLCAKCLRAATKSLSS